MSDREYVNRTAERIAVSRAVHKRRDQVANSRIAVGCEPPTDASRAIELGVLSGLISETVADGRYVEDFELLDVAAVCQAWLEDRAQERAA